jgi:hypothetical protein
MDNNKRSERRIKARHVKLTHDIVQLVKRWNKVRDVVFVTDWELCDSPDVVPVPDSSSALTSLLYGVCFHLQVLLWTYVNCR